MYITGKINAILSSMVEDTSCPLMSSQYNDKPTANVTLDRNKPSPTAVFLQITDHYIDTSSLMMYEKASVVVSFLDKEVVVDSQALTQEEIIDNMSSLAKDFIGRVLDDGCLVIDGGTIDIKSVFHRSDSNRTGVSVIMTLRKRQGECLSK